MSLAGAYTNPLIRHTEIGDPWMVFHDGFYYLTGTVDARHLYVWKSPTLAGLNDVEPVTVWTSPESGLRSRQVWAPEMHWLDGRWYLYYTASDGVDANHRHYVLESEDSDPLGPYQDRGPMHPEWNRYAIDGSVLPLPDGRRFWMYAANGLWIAPMESPTRAVGPGVRFLTGTEEWERSWHFESGTWRKSTSDYWIEAPTALVRGGQVWLTYSAGHTAVDDYYIGLLRLDGDNPTDPNQWYKYPDPVLGPYTDASGRRIVSLGHNSFTITPDGKIDLVVFHAREGGKGANLPGDTYPGRMVHAQPFRWDADGTPNFGHAVPPGVPIAL